MYIVQFRYVNTSKTSREGQTKQGIYRKTMERSGMFLAKFAVYGAN